LRCPLNPFTTTQTALTAPLIDPQPGSIAKPRSAGLTFQIPQHVPPGHVQQFQQSLVSDLVDGTERMNPGQKQHLRFIDVADSTDNRLIQQDLANGALAVRLQPADAQFPVELAIQQIGSQLGQPSVPPQSCRRQQLKQFRLKTGHRH